MGGSCGPGQEPHAEQAGRTYPPVMPVRKMKVRVICSRSPSELVSEGVSLCFGGWGLHSHSSTGSALQTAPGAWRQHEPVACLGVRGVMHSSAQPPATLRTL